jgi:hypothetical protein
MCLRSGAEFVPYALKRTLCPPPLLQNPISTEVDVEPLLQGATAREDIRFEHGEDDSEGLGVTSRPSTPPTEVESEDDAEDPPQPHPAPGAHSAAKRHRNAAAKKRRAKKRVRLATSGHQPHAYAADPSTATYHAEEQLPLQVSADAGDFPASGTGSWVGLRRKGVKKVPWTVSELAECGFTFIEWDGW